MRIALAIVAANVGVVLLALFGETVVGAAIFRVAGTLLGILVIAYLGYVVGNALEDD